MKMYMEIRFLNNSKII